MKNLTRILLGILFASIMFGCKKETPPSYYKFFVAGHIYGSPNNTAAGIHPPFLDKFGLINKTDSLKFGILTGDIVKASTKERWDVLEDEISNLKVPVHYVPGNHELGLFPDYYKSRFGKTYYSFEENKDLFIVLNPFDNKWNITGEQLSFLKNTLNEKMAGASNVFVFFHQLLWWSPDNKFKNIPPNSTDNRAGQINFEEKILPLFQKSNKPVFFFAGDIGALPGKDAFIYNKSGNITYIASGMGGETADNFIIVKVGPNEEISFELIALNTDDIHSLGKLEDYRLP